MWFRIQDFGDQAEAAHSQTSADGQSDSDRRSTSALYGRV